MPTPQSLVIILFITSLLAAQSPAPPPVTRIVLYKNGVGYFEHLARVAGNQQVSLPFTSGQLDDVLKSLTLLDLDGGRIGGVTYGSSAPVDRQLADLRLPLDEKPTLTTFLGALRGARLEVRSGTSVVTGRLLSMERKTRISGGTTLEVDYLSLLTDSGEVRTAELSPAFSVRLLDPGLAAKVGRYLDLAASAREPDLRRMTVSALGSGDRSLFLSYVSEVPVWKSTYRIVLPAKSGELPLLQGWAIIDNPTAQDWENVRISLVAGAPQSFIQQLSQPYYGRRPVVPLPEAAALTPQTFQSTLSSGPARLSGVVTDASGAALPGVRVVARTASGTLAGEAVADGSGRYEFASLPDGLTYLSVEAPGFQRAVASEVLTAAAATRNFRLEVGSTSETVTVSAEAAPVNTSTASAASRSTGTGRALGRDRNLGGIGTGRGGGIGSGEGGGFGGGAFRISDSARLLPAAALAQSLGDMFEYEIKEPLTLRRNQSALVPIVNARIGAEKVSLWNAQTPVPLRALWLHNNSGLTLDTGSFSVLEKGAFAGEGIFAPIRPNEKRLVSYAADTALTTSTAQASAPQRITRVAVSKGAISHYSELVEKKTYTARNADSVSRTLLIEHPVRNAYTLRAPAKADETTPSFLRFRLPVPAGQTASLTVEEARPIEDIIGIAKVDAPRLTAFIAAGSITPDIEKALRKVLSDRAAIEALDSQKSALEARRDAIFDDQQRLRENMKSLKSSPEEKSLLQRYTRQLSDQETELEKLKTEIAALEEKQSAAEAALETFIQSLAFDARL